MARKNGNVRRTNNKGRLDRRQRGESRPRLAVPAPRTSIEDVVLPDGQCTFMNPRKPKARFATKEKAAEALKQAQRVRARTGSGHVERRFYKCPDGGCGGFHLTSRETFDDGVRRLRREQFEAKTKNARREEIRREQ